MHTIVTSVAKVKTYGITHNTQSTLPIYFLLQQMDHVQPLAPLKIDNKITEAFVGEEMCHKKSKS